MHQVNEGLNLNDTDSGITAAEITYTPRDVDEGDEISDLDLSLAGDDVDDFELSEPDATTGAVTLTFKNVPDYEAPVPTPTRTIPIR